MSYGNGKQSWVEDTLSNRPFVVAALFVSCLFLPFLIVVAVPLLYIFRREPREDWEVTHYRYLARTFWLALCSTVVVGTIGLIAIANAVPTMQWQNDIIYALITLVVTGVFLAQFGARSVLSMARAAAKEPMPRPATWLC